MEALDIAVGLWPIGAGFLDGGTGGFAGVVPEAGAVAGAVVGQDALTVDTGEAEPVVGSVPEPGGGVGLFVAVLFGIDEAGAVIDRGVKVDVAGAGMAFVGVVAAAVEVPAAAGGDRREFLDVNMGQLARMVSLIADHRSCRAVARVETTEAGLVQDGLHRRGRQPDLVSDAGGTPSVPLP